MYSFIRVILFTLIILAAVTVSTALSQNIQQISAATTPSYMDVTDMEVSGNYAYITTSNLGLLIFDIAQPSLPYLRGSYSDAPYNFLKSVFISGDFAFVTTSFPDELAMLNITDPQNPVLLGSYLDSIYIEDIWVVGQNAFLAGRDSSLVIVNFSNPAMPELVSRIPLMDRPFRLFVSDYYLFISEGNYLEIFDIFNPNGINRMGIDSSAFFVNIFVQNNYLYSSHNGLRIYDISNPATPSLMGQSPAKGDMINVYGNYAFMVYDDIIACPSVCNHLTAIDITNPSSPKRAGDLALMSNLRSFYPAVRHDTLFLSGNSYFHVYKLSEQGLGTLYGYVRDRASFEPLSGVIVNAYWDWAETTDVEGRFIFDNVYNLEYKTLFQRDGYFPFWETIEVSANDTAVMNYWMNSYYHIYDVGIDQILSPPVSIPVPGKYPLSALVKNFLNITACSISAAIDVYFRNSTTPIISDSVFIDILEPESEISVIFAESLTVIPETTYFIKCYTRYSHDENIYNDTVRIEVGNFSYDIEIWYGNPNGSPVVAVSGDTFRFDVYAMMRPGIVAGSWFSLSLGVNDEYVDSLMSRQYGKLYSPFSNTWTWDASFFNPVHSPPNPARWSAETFFGYLYESNRNYQNYLYNTWPYPIFSMVMHASGDSNLLGQTVNAFGPGSYPDLTTPFILDTLEGLIFRVREHYNQLYFTPQCDYVLGDVNGDGHSIGGDVTYAVRYFKSSGLPPVDSCFMDSTQTWFYPAGDVNGDCQFRGSDVTRMVAYFKSNIPMANCHFFPQYH